MTDQTHYDSDEAELMPTIEDDQIDDTQDLGETQPVAEATEPQIEVIGQRRVFVIGGTRIPEGDSTIGQSNEAVREMLKASFPEVANATIRPRTENGVDYVEFLPQPGRKG